MGPLILVGLVIYFVFIRPAMDDAEDMKSREQKRQMGDFLYTDTKGATRSVKTGERASFLTIGFGQVVFSTEDDKFGQVIEVRGDIHHGYKHNSLMVTAHDKYVASGGKYCWIF